MQPSPRSDRAGLLISGRYRVRRRLGVGTVGSVWLARDLTLDRDVAVKIVRAEHLGAEGLAQLQGEFRSVAGLHHPQIATAFDFGYTQDGRLPFYTREYIEGAPIPAGPPGPDGQSDPHAFLRPIFDLLDALHYLHAHGILHLDIHADNLIVAADTARGSVLIDFGLLQPALVRGATTRGLSSRARLRSTPAHPSTGGTASLSTAPEILAGEKPVPASDVWSVGRLLLYRLTGSYSGSGRLPREVPGWSSRLTLELERIVGKAIETDHRRRFPSAQEFRRALSRALGSGTGDPIAVEPGELTVGRDAELALVDDVLHDARERGAACAWLSGPAGIGKTRLLTEARWRAQLLGLDVVRVEFRSDASSAPALEQALRSALGTRRHDEPAEWLDALSTDHGGTTGTRADRAAESYFAVPAPPLVLLLDDLDTADRESRVLAEALIRETARRRDRDASAAGRGLAVIATSRQAPSRDLRTAADPARLRQLGRLDRSTAASLLRTLLRPLEPSDALVHACVARARGCPRRLRQIAIALHSAPDALGRLSPDALVPEIPLATIEDASSVDAIQRRILDALATIDRPAEAGELAAALGTTRARIGAALRKLRATELVRDTRSGRTRLWTLTTREAAATFVRRGSPRAPRGRPPPAPPGAPGHTPQAGAGGRRARGGSSTAAPASTSSARPD